ncbi:MAG: DUF2273 domain-containing protein [Eubacteriales bacterium]|nr:DUF2273 domain-containing protein [Eubacteriales bacterium]MDD4326878.1 DUF2273 domain-containing protein [Eubacteriales bacterium]MDD4717555.1 DUF2273 domain-containing protein [Eubacteriales bacterium]NCU26051.1 DUF2273 domain-containing protein [Candidatus Nomurabacteria bacterium]
MKRLFDEFREMSPQYKGAVTGFTIALLLAVFGFLKFILIVVFSISGYYIGKKIFANKEALKEFLDRILPPGRFR